MKKSILTLAAFAATATLYTSCKSNSEFETTKDGLVYKIVKDEPGDVHPKIGDVVSLHLLTKVGDSVVFDSRAMNNNQVVEFPLTAPGFKGDVPEGIMLLTKGDSAIFKVPIDSIQKMGAQLLPFMKPGDFVVYHIKLEDFKTQAEAQKMADAAGAEQATTDDKILQDYFAKNNLKPSKTSGGMYYIVEKEGTGENIKPGSKASMNYTGKTLAGKVFDSNVDPKREAFTFTVGRGEVIQGWDEGITYLKKGSKAKFFIPSGMAYGPNAPSADIQPNEILVFDVEVVDVK